jgi:hypothetical protein
MAFDHACCRLDSFLESSAWHPTHTLLTFLSSDFAWLSSLATGQSSLLFLAGRAHLDLMGVRIHSATLLHFGAWQFYGHSVEKAKR